MATCAKSGCEKSTYRRYCSRHRCKAVESCENPRQKQSGVCAEHTPCTKEGCDEPRYFCDNPRAANTFCDEHFCSCRLADCFSPPKTQPPSDDDPPNYCHEHACKTPDCVHKKGSSRDTCRQHRCDVADCNEIGADTAEGRSCCELHGCQLPGCREPSRHAQAQAKVSPFCNYHDCRAPGCESGRDLDGGRKYCEAHDICGKVDCKGIKDTSKPWTWRFCVMHWDTCAHLDCFSTWGNHGRARRYMEYIYSRAMWSYTADGESAEYCENHTCTGEGCVAARESGRVYCAAHDVCTKKDCLRVVSMGVSHCSRHEDWCSVEDCLNWSIGKDQTFCSSHGCAAPRCSWPREKASRYCGSYHTRCEAPQCTEPCEIPGRACGDAHRCRRSGCLEAISSLEVDYCLRDICKAERCSNAKQNVFDRRVGHEFCINHESMARHSRPLRALPSSDVGAFNDPLLLLPKKKKHASRKAHASGSSGGIGFVIGEVADDSSAHGGPVDDYGGPGDDYGGENYYDDAGPSYIHDSAPDEDGHAEGDHELHAEQDGSNRAADDADHYEPIYADAVGT